jgi:hypothetical protein
VFKKGDKKPANSGIKKGQKQSRTQLRRRVMDVLHDAGIHPVTELLKLMPELSARDQAQTWIHLLSYTEPKMSAQILLEQSQTPLIDVSPEEVSDEELLENLNK